MSRRRCVGAVGWIVAWFGFLSVLPAIAAENMPEPTVGQKVFVCGHSFHVPLAESLDELAEAAHLTGHELVGKQFIGGSRVVQQWNLPDERNQAKRALLAGKVDVLTLSPMPFLPDEGIDKFAALALEHNPNCRILVQASWFPYDKPDPPAGFTNADRDQAKINELRDKCQPFYERITSQIQDLNGKYKDKAGRQIVFAVPVGHAVLALRAKVAAGEVPGIRQQSELFQDTIGHGRPPIVALAAYCHYCVIYGKSPVGLPTPSVLKKEQQADALNKVLQEISWSTTTGDPLTGVKK